jgi:hypothetical protein
VVGVSAVFMFIYALALASYVRTPRPLARRVGAGVLLAAMLAILASQGWYALPPVMVATLAFFATRRRTAVAAILRPASAGSANGGQ